jgi:flagellar biosynthetic protein FliP
MVCDLKISVLNSGFFKRAFLGFILFGGSLQLASVGNEALGQTRMPKIELNLQDVEDPDAFLPALKIVAALTILSVAPAILLMMTSFTRIIVVLAFIRQALGTQSMPPNQVLIGLSLFLTLFTMSPVIDKAMENGINPYIEKSITQTKAIDEIIKPIRKFMLSEVRQSDLGVFMNISKLEKPLNAAGVPLKILMPAFLISELKTAFQMGFLIYIPFLIIDMVVASILMAMGMMMLPPTVVSLPFKLVLFVLVDGWSILVDSLVKSFVIMG